MTRVILGKSRVRESRTPGSVRVKAEWLNYSTTTRISDPRADRLVERDGFAPALRLATSEITLIARKSLSEERSKLEAVGPKVATTGAARMVWQFRSITSTSFAVVAATDRMSLALRVRTGIACQVIDFLASSLIARN
jgi:hypothetical protein